MIGKKFKLRVGAAIFALMIALVPAGPFLTFPASAGVVRAAEEDEDCLFGVRYPFGLDEETAEWVDAAGEELASLAAEREIMALVYLADSYSVKACPDADSETIVTVLSGQMVTIDDVAVGSEYDIWERVCLEYRGAEYSGYVQRSNLAVSDERFIEWEANCGLGPVSTYAVSENGVYEDIEQFPESYRQPLSDLKALHPNWTFVKMNTTLDWETAIREEMKGGKSLVHRSLPDWTKNGLYDQGNWYYATEPALKMYMDPRNALTEDAVFQFEQLTYNEKYHTLEAVQKFLDNTFMKGKPANGKDALTYAELFWYIGGEKGREVSPFHLAARVLQEQGAGTSPLISGTYPGYEGYYNYFNIGATGTTNQQVIENGLAYAKSHGWTLAYYSIQGGADFISANYIKRGQDSLYLQKFNVNPNGSYAVFTHQYMQNISAPTTEAASVKRLYANAGALDSPFVFKIPVYENMPEKPCGPPSTGEPEQPVETLKFTLELPEGYRDETVWIDGVAHSGTKVSAGNTAATGRAEDAGADGEKLLIEVEADDKTAKTAVSYRYSDAGVPEGMYVWSLEYKNGSYAATPEPGLEDLLTYHGFSARITGKTGIRFKTGISIDTRNALTSVGVDGYRLKEYGTLAMIDADRAKNPMIKGGSRVKSGMSYGTDENGGRTDVAFEIADGRYRFTSVLVGIPVKDYETEMAFRGYIILEKEGAEVTLYGPIMARSIYVQAERYLASGVYAPGTEANDFLTKIVQDADAYREGNK